MVEDLVNWAMAMIGAIFAYFYKRNEASRDEEIMELKQKFEHVDRTTVKKDDFKEFKEQLFEEIRAVRKRLDDIADRK